VTWAIRTWLVWAEPFGLGELALLPDQFWHLSIREFRLLRDGFFRREDRAWLRVATLGVWVLAPHSKKKLTPLELLGRRKLQTLPPGPQREAPTNDAQAEAEAAHVLAQALAWAKD